VASVTIDRIDGVRRDIADAVIRTAEGSTLPEPEQERLLAQACIETCALLTDWVGSPQWEDLRPERDGVLREALQDQEQFGELLGPLFGDAIERTLSGGDAAEGRAERLNAARAEAERAVRGALASSRRYPRLRCEQLVEAAVDRVGKLRVEICELAEELGSARQEAEKPGASAGRRAGRLRKARSALVKAGGFLLTLSVSLTMSVPGPGQVIHDLSAWTDQVKVVMVHDLAAQAQPGIRVAPPASGPRLR
jgi:hypothetical protein